MHVVVKTLLIAQNLNIDATDDRVCVCVAIAFGDIEYTSERREEGKEEISSSGRTRRARTAYTHTQTRCVFPIDKSRNTAIQAVEFVCKWNLMCGN